MNLLYPALIWGLIQLSANITWAASNNSSQPTSTTAKEKLVIFYENELQLLAEEFCEKAKNLSEKLLQDPKIQQASSPLIKEFKMNITEFLSNYEFYKRHNLHNDLLIKFISTTIHYHLQDPNPDKDSQYILQLLNKLQYEKLCDDYELKFQKLIKQKFLPKFEELKAQLLANNTKQSQDLLNWFNDLKKCPDYKCHYKYFSKFQTVLLAPKDQLFQYIKTKLEDINIFYTNTAYNISKALIKDPRLQEINPEIAQEFAKDINAFISNYERNQDIEKLYDLMQFFFGNILQKYYYNTNIPLRDHQLLEKIFINQDLNKFQSNYQLKFNQFLEQGLDEKFQYYKKSLNQEELMREQPLLQWFDHLLNLRSYAERVQEFSKLYQWI